MSDPTDYHPSPWEKLLSGIVASSVVALVGFLVIRNEPFAEPQFASLVRILLSLAVAVLGATIPGFLRVDLSVRGLTVRAAGALALFVITYFFSPSLAPSLAPDVAPLRNPRPVTTLVLDFYPRLTPVQWTDNSKKAGLATNPLVLRSAFQGDSPANRKFYDLTISSSSHEQKILRNFHVRWLYEKGSLASVEQGVVLAPTQKYSVLIPVDIDKAHHILEEDVPMSPAILLPPRNQDGPSITTIRLEVLYRLVGRLDYHPYDGWELYYQVSVEDDSGDSLTLLSRSWRRDKNINWVQKFNDEIPNQ